MFWRQDIKIYTVFNRHNNLQIYWYSYNIIRIYNAITVLTENYSKAPTCSQSGFALFNRLEVLFTLLEGPAWFTRSASTNWSSLTPPPNCPSGSSLRKSVLASSSASRAPSVNIPPVDLYTPTTSFSSTCTCRTSWRRVSSEPPQTHTGSHGQLASSLESQVANLCLHSDSFHMFEIRGQCTRLPRLRGRTWCRGRETEPGRGRRSWCCAWTPCATRRSPPWSSWCSSTSRSRPPCSARSC